MGHRLMFNVLSTASFQATAPAAARPVAPATAVDPIMDVAVRERDSRQHQYPAKQPNQPTTA